MYRTLCAAVLGGLISVCVVDGAAAQTPRLYWDGDGTTVVSGYAVTIDGVRTDHAKTPLRTDGTCGCSIAVPFSGGHHTIVVSAYNTAGERASAPLQVGPSANAGGPYSATAGAAVAVTGAASLAPTGSLVRYTWRWGDGSADTTTTTAAASHVYGSAGTYTVTLTVTDNAGATASASTTAAIAASSTLPSPWLTQDIGNVGRAGSASYANGLFTIVGAGADIWSTSDGFRFVYRPLTGDGQIVARVTGLTNTNIYAKAGVMIRESLSASSPHALLDSRPGTGIEFLVRGTTSGSTAVAGSGTQAFPAWLRLTRTGQSIVASVSADGSSWSVVGTRTVTMASSVLVGLAVTSHDLALLNTATFDNVTMTTGASTQPPAVPSSPTPGTGATGVSTTAALTWSAVGATSYDLNFGTTNPPPRIVSGHATNSYQASNLNAGTQYYWQVVARNAAGASTGPVWSFTTAAATSTGVPAPWLNQDVGSVGRAGRASHSSGTFTIEGSGADIWHTADAFHFVHRPLSGSGEIVARVMSLTNTHYYAKAGVMMREDVGAAAAHVLLNLLPNGQVEFITRRSTGGTTAYIAGSWQSPPAWLKLVRSGSTVTGFASRDGAAWTQVGSTAVTLSSGIQAGLAVTSHDTALINKAVFDNVAVSAGGTAPPPITSTGDSVIYASDIPAAARHGAWQSASDPQSPNGVKLATADTGLAVTNQPLASPQHYVDVTFNANANTPYRFWLRLRAAGDSKWNDAVWVQFSDALVGGAPAYRMNSTSGLMVNLATEASASSLQGWGWQNGAYWLSQPTVVTFPTSGVHTLRIQIREDGVQFDQIVLSPSRFMSQAPGSVGGDSVIVPKD